MTVRGGGPGKLPEERVPSQVWRGVTLPGGRGAQLGASNRSEGLGLDWQEVSETRWQVCWRVVWETWGADARGPGGEAGRARCSV